MSKYTTTINKILTSFIPDYMENNYTIDDIISLSYEKFFDFDFIWYANNLYGLNDFKKNFLKYYFNEYIGFETLGMFKMRMSAILNTEIPYYQELYKHTSQGYEPFININVEYTKKETENNTSSNNYNEKGNTEQNAEEIISDNPQVTVGSRDYASGMSRNQQINDYTSNRIENGKNNKNLEYIDKEKGLRGKSKAEVIKELKNQIININKELILKCEPLFLKVW